MSWLNVLILMETLLSQKRLLEEIRMLLGTSVHVNIVDGAQ